MTNSKYLDTEIATSCNAPDVTTTAHPHTYGERLTVAGLKCGAIAFQVSPRCRGNDGVLKSGRFSFAKGVTKSKVLTSSLPPGVGLIAGH